MNFSACVTVTKTLIWLLSLMFLASACSCKCQITTAVSLDMSCQWVTVFWPTGCYSSVYFMTSNSSNMLLSMVHLIQYFESVWCLDVGGGSLMCPRTGAKLVCSRAEQLFEFKSKLQFEMSKSRRLHFRIYIMHVWPRVWTVLSVVLQSHAVLLVQQSHFWLYYVWSCYIMF